MKSLYIKISKGKAEETRCKLIQLKLFDSTRKILKEKNFVFLPVSKKTSIKGAVYVKKKSIKIKSKPKSLKEALKNKLSASELKLLHSSFDVVGDIAILEIPEGLIKKEKIIADAMLDTFKSIKVVALKTSAVSSDYRVRGVKVIAGENRTVTVHKEHGCLYQLDVSSAYFSPRLGAERLRVAGKVKKGEHVLVMFAGVGPYAILIAKKCNPEKVVAVELNPDAVKFMESNRRMNKVNVNVIEGDVRDVTPTLGSFDRIAMPLPKDARNFLDVALPALKSNGVVHFYDFAENPEESALRLKKICDKLGYKISVLDSVLCGSYSPTVNRVCVDFKIIKK